jgi:uncharacterized protein
MNKAKEAEGYVRTAIKLMALVLPAASLMLVGLLWLLEKGALLMWAVGAAVVTAMVYSLGKSLIKEATTNKSKARENHKQTDTNWTGREAEAWETVEKIAKEIDPGRLNSRNAFLAVGGQTIDAVGRTLFPGEDNPLWRFSIPELMALVRRVSNELDPVVRKNIPFGETLSVGQAMALYQWRSVIGVTEAAYDIWNLIQSPAPAAAKGSEEQEKNRLPDRQRNELGRRIAAAYVREVGRAAIDLYSGRLAALPAPKPSDQTNAAANTTTAQKDAANPLRLLVVGQVASGKSSLVSALLREIRAKVQALPPTKGLRAYELKHADVAAALLIDAPGIEADDLAIESLKAQAEHCDLLIWVTSAVNKEKSRDRNILDALQRAARAARRNPPVITVYTHVDQLQPILEWEPPYNLNRAETEKAQSIGKALVSVSTELGLPLASIVPVSLDQMRGVYNIDMVWAKSLEVLPDAQRTQLVGALIGAGDLSHWMDLWTDARINGRIMTRTNGIPAPKNKIF